MSDIVATRQASVSVSPRPGTDADMTIVQRPDTVLLLGKGGYGDAPRAELDRMVAAVRSTGRYQRIEGTFLDQGTPALLATLQACTAAGARRMLIVPVFVPMDRSLRIWLPKVIRRWLRRRPELEIEVLLADTLGDHAALGEAVCRVVVAAEQRADVRIGAPVDRGDPSWSVNPLHRYHALFCLGPRCSTHLAGDLYRHLCDRLAEHGLDSGPEQVRTVQTGCLYPCNLGPVMAVYPEGAWYCALTPSMLDRIVEEHFIDGRVIADYTCPPAPRPYKRPAVEGEP